MLITCLYVLDMSGMIQIRNVPPDLHRLLKARAAMAGTSLSEFLLREIAKVADRPTLDELRERLSSRTPVNLDESPEAAVRAERDER